MTTSTPSDELSIETLRALRFADLSRRLLHGYCKHSPDLYTKLLSNIAIVPDEVIESVALSFFQDVMSMSDSQAALTFFSSAEGRVISTKMVESDPPRLTSSELKALDDFGSAPPGQALQCFLGHAGILPAMATAIADYVP
jgi:hypothetical protein